MWDCKSICNQYVVSTCLTWAFMILMWGCRPSLPFAAERSGAGSAGRLWSGGAEARNSCIPGRLPWKIWDNLLRNVCWLHLDFSWLQKHQLEMIGRNKLSIPHLCVIKTWQFGTRHDSLIYVKNFSWFLRHDSWLLVCWWDLWWLVHEQRPMMERKRQRERSKQLGTSVNQCTCVRKGA